MKFPKLSPKILIYLIIILLAVVFIYLGYAFGKKIFPFGSEKYQAVQLQNGDVYYGKLQIFPCCKLSETFFIRQTSFPTEEEGEEQAGTELVPFSSMFFGPENVMHLQKEQILWWADLSGNSQILKAIKEIKE